MTLPPAFKYGLLALLAPALALGLHLRVTHALPGERTAARDAAIEAAASTLLRVAIDAAVASLIRSGPPFVTVEPGRAGRPAVLCHAVPACRTTPHRRHGDPGGPYWSPPAGSERLHGRGPAPRRQRGPCDHGLHGS